MKNLANCKPSEFIRQTNRIRKSVEKWLTVTDIMNIRKNVPKYETASEGMTKEAEAEMFLRNKRKRDEQALKNLSAILDAILEKHPDETLELLALLCFVEPKDVDNYTINEYLQSITEMITDSAVTGFFTSLEKLGLMNTSNA